MLARAHQIAQLGVGLLQEREADELALGYKVGDDGRVLGVGLERLIVGDFLPVLGVRGQHAHDRKALVVEVVGKGEAVGAGELDPNQDVTWSHPGCGRVDRAERRLEALARDGERHWLRISATGWPNDQGMSKLAGIDADDGASVCGELALLVCGEGGQAAGLAHGRRSSKWGSPTKMRAMR